jgi:hypothetical protein
MRTVMAVNDLYEAAVIQNMHAQECVNVLHYRVASMSGAPSSTEVAQALSTWIGINIVGPMKAFQSSALVHNGVRVQRIQPLPRTAGVYNATANGLGAVADLSLASHTAAVITKTTEFVGRAYRGRIYVAGVPQGSESLSKLTDAAATSLGPLATSLTAVFQLPGLSGVTMASVLLSNDRSRVTPINGATVRYVLRVQRRRTPTVGN